MANKSDIEAGAAYVRLYTKGFDQVMGQFNNFGKSLIGIGSTIAGIGLGIGAGLTAAVAHFVDVGGAIDDMAHRTGMARGQLQKLSYGAGQVGIEMGKVEAAVKGMIKNGFSPSEFDRIVAEINSIKDSTERAQRAMQVFGKAGFDVLQLLEEWEGISSRAAELGIGLSDADIALADQLGDAWADIGATMSGIVAKIGAGLAPVLVPIVEGFVQIAAATGKWVDENRALVPVIAAVAVGLVAVGGAIVGVGAVLVAAGAVAASISAIAAFVTPLGLAVAAAVAIGVALVAAAAAWVAFSEQGQRLIRQLTLEWNAAFREMGKVFGGLSDAMKASRLDLAFAIVCNGMRIIWLETIRLMQQDVADVVKSLTLGLVSVEPVLVDPVKAASAQARNVQGLLEGIASDQAAKASGASAAREMAGGMGTVSPILTGFNPEALMRAGMLSSFDPALQKADKQIGLLEGIKGTLDQILNKTGRPEVATA